VSYLFFGSHNITPQQLFFVYFGLILSLILPLKLEFNYNFNLLFIIPLLPNFIYYCQIKLYYLESTSTCQMENINLNGKKKKKKTTTTLPIKKYYQDYITVV
jgi:hypothetical protein